MGNPIGNAVEDYKALLNGDGLRILEYLPEIIQRGAESLTPAEKELLKWVGVFYRRPTRPIRGCRQRDSGNCAV